MIGVIAARELAAWFRSPLAWILLAIIQGVAAFIFLLHLDSYLDLQPELRSRAHRAPPAFSCRACSARVARSSCWPCH